MALLPRIFLDAVVCIGIPAGAAGNELGTTTSWTGTGVLVGRPFAENTFHPYLVTNKHVVNGRPRLIVRMNVHGGNQITDFLLNSGPQDEQQWGYHPSNEVDIAVVGVDPNVMAGANAQFSFFDPSQCMTVAEMTAEQVCEGDNLFVLGFPLGLVGDDRRNAVARAGIIARISDTLDGRNTSFLIDANVFPGNSGGPVILRPEATFLENTTRHDRALLIGIVKSYLLFKDVAVSQQTGNARIIFEENSGLALVETIDSIKEAIELQFAKYPRN